jgi:uncharacterized protein (DUF305 family)
MKRARTIPVVAVGLAAALALAACGHPRDTTSHGTGHTSPRSTASSAGSGIHDAADTMFAQMMIPHHRQALEMAELAATRAADPKVAELAAKIETEQEPEIRTMTAWLAAWGEPVPDVSGGMNHGAMGHGAMPGMMGDADLAKLRAAGGTAFDRMFLQMMIDHHTGAVQMARTELAQGKSAEAKTLAKAIVATQTAEIAEMHHLLTTLD